MDERDIAGPVGVRVFNRRRAMRGPTGMPDPKMPDRSLVRHPLYKIGQFSFRLRDMDLGTLHHCEPRAVIAAILKPGKTLQKTLCDVTLSQDAYNSTHATLTPFRKFIAMISFAAHSARCAEARARWGPKTTRSNLLCGSAPSPPPAPNVIRVDRFRPRSLRSRTG